MQIEQDILREVLYTLITLIGQYLMMLSLPPPLDVEPGAAVSSMSATSLSSGCCCEYSRDPAVAAPADSATFGTVPESFHK